MPVRDSGMKAHLVTPQLLLQILNKHISLFRRNMTGRVVFNNLSIYADQVTAHGHLSRFEINTNTCRFECSPALVHFRQVVTQN
ncbi:hypothetical protein SDC9_133514 [bioreactor metagenome]|uniref:Uncharacterized protein n=1 Tax=bioreactor metagenome TaxID=1076179 RepID=A0A645DB05_9ZZZZ